jgi:hypothetical protein
MFETLLGRQSMAIPADQVTSNKKPQVTQSQLVAGAMERW